MYKYSLILIISYIFLSCQVEKIPEYGIFEAAFINEISLEDPYVDVELTVEFESPEGSKIMHYGFYDGERTWKVRFMPGQSGTWKYKAAFSNGHKAGSGRFQCVDPVCKGPLGPYEENPVWFATRNGDPILVRSFHVGDRFFAENWPGTGEVGNDPRGEFLDWFQQKGYNTLSIASFFTNRQSEGRGAGWDTPEMWPLNYAEFQKAEAILNELAEREIYIFPFAGFFGRNGNWPVDHSEQERYIKYVLARWGAYYNLLFNVAGPEPLLDSRPEHKAGYKNQMEISDLDRIAGWIHKYDPFDHMVTVHNKTSASRDGDPFRDKTWYNFSTIQGPKTNDLQRHRNAVHKIRHPGKPYYAQETLWGGNMHHPDYEIEFIRKIGIVLTMNAAMINFADNNGNSSSGYSGSLDLRDWKPHKHEELRKVWNFFERQPIGKMKPDTVIAPGQFVLAGKERILIYIPEADSFRLNLNNEKIYRTEWINAEKLNQPSQKGGNANPQKWIKVPEGGDDWFLILFRV